MAKKVCAFFGHRDCPSDIKVSLRAEIIRLITEQQIENFLVGYQGNFDALALQVLIELKEEFQNIQYTVVLAYLPNMQGELFAEVPTVFPEILETTHPKYAISARNTWMISRADCVIAYVQHTWGGAYRFVSYAKRKGKMVINLAE